MPFKHLTLILLALFSAQNAYSQDWRFTDFENKLLALFPPCFEHKKFGTDEHLKTCKTIRRDIDSLVSNHSPLSHDEKNTLSFSLSTIEQTLARSTTRIQMKLAKDGIRTSKEENILNLQIYCDHFRKALEEYKKIEPPTAEWLGIQNNPRPDLTGPTNQCNKQGY